MSYVIIFLGFGLGMYLHWSEIMTHPAWFLLLGFTIAIVADIARGH